MGLEKFSGAPVVTRSSLARLVEVRKTVHSVASEPRLASLKNAAQAVTVACRKIDSPEQGAEDAVDSAIDMLSAGNYRAMLERFTPPSELDEMRKSGRLDQMVGRFADGWGQVLLRKLKLARTTMPIVNKDGTITFEIPGIQDTTTRPVTLVAIEGEWYLRD